MIPRIIHQIWLSDANKISPIREALINTLKNTNPTYKYILWTQANITREQFPITYDGIRKF
jgi:mannosyltransferase OCH1-like enzyme